MKRKKQHLSWIQLLLIKFLAEVGPRPATVLRAAANEFIDTQGVPHGYAFRVSPGQNQVYRILDELRTLRFVQGTYTLTPRGADLADTLDFEQWEKWPIELPLKGGEADWENAKYHPMALKGVRK